MAGEEILPIALLVGGGILFFAKEAGFKIPLMSDIFDTTRQVKPMETKIAEAYKPQTRVMLSDGTLTDIVDAQSLGLGVDGYPLMRFTLMDGSNTKHIRTFTWRDVWVMNPLDVNNPMVLRELAPQEKLQINDFSDKLAHYMINMPDHTEIKRLEKQKDVAEETSRMVAEDYIQFHSRAKRAEQPVNQMQWGFPEVSK